MVRKAGFSGSGIRLTREEESSNEAEGSRGESTRFLYLYGAGIVAEIASVNQLLDAPKRPWISHAQCCVVALGWHRDVRRQGMEDIDSFKRYPEKRYV